MPVSGRWAILLAAGEGTRLHGISRDEFGNLAPKQYCSFGTGRTLLAHSLDRARRVVHGDCIVPVVAEHHREWWLPAFAGEGLSEVVIQPSNRGTAPGVLLPLWHIARRDPDATVVLLPADHVVEDEDSFAGSVRAAARHVERRSGDIVLLGVPPNRAESDYGWIVPGRLDGLGPRRVSRFVEKPAPALAVSLMGQGGLWNSFVLAFRARTLLEIYGSTQRELVDLFTRHLDGPEKSGVGELYAQLPVADFSRDILEAIPERLRVVRTPPCGWTDLGTPARLSRWANPQTTRALVVARKPRPLSAALSP